MDPLTPFAAIAVLLPAMLTTWFVARRGTAPAVGRRFDSLDGLRGYLAFFVFLHHAAIWYFYLRTGNWSALPSNLYSHFGRSSVAMFFMITGFLFFSKLIDARTRPINWTRLFISRILRLVPLYVFVMASMFLVVGFVSGFTLREPLADLADHMASWLMFTVFDEPDINLVHDTLFIVAGVTWSLPYEWFFYLALPALGVLVRASVPKPYAALGLVAGVGFTSRRSAAE